MARKSDYERGYRWFVDVHRQRLDGTRDVVRISFVNKPTREEILIELDGMADLGTRQKVIGPLEPVLDLRYKSPIELANMSMLSLVCLYNSLGPHIKAKPKTFKDKAAIIPKITELQGAYFENYQVAVQRLLEYQDSHGEGIPYRFVLLCLQAEFPEIRTTLQDLQNYAKRVDAVQRDF